MIRAKLPRFTSTPNLTQQRVFLSFNGRKFSSTAATAQEKLFDKILIANRGEIACRVMRTCKKLGIKTVAVFSEADTKSEHTKMADEAVCVGPAPSSQSYLNVKNIIEAIRLTGAQAVHPGYGFLSENFHFVEELDKIGCTFIGPSVSAMHAMGDKIESKKLAQKAGVNIIPGFLGEVHTPEEVLNIAHSIGYPVMIKASAGGGGKGMRIAWNDEEALEGFNISKREALSSFADDRMLIEKFIDNPRHIEIQVLCDGKGTSLYLNERECSIQRRNQKVIEEAPSPFLTPEVRKAMGSQAILLANAVGYTTAGTVEMLVDSQRNFYFLEMNTRLQVEHPITEYITGVDIVEQMIRIAAGHKLNMTQDDIKINGWAVESRVYAEDPKRNFLPSIGTLTTYVEPKKAPEVRVDTGVSEGSEISINYDPLIAKLATHGATRNEAIDNMIHALDSYRIEGVEHNISFLRSVMTNKRFVSGNLSTKFIPEEYPHGFVTQFNEKETRQLIIAAALKYYDFHTRNSWITGQLNSAEYSEKEDLQSLNIEFAEQHYKVSIVPEEEQSIVTVNGEEFAVGYEYDAGAKTFDISINNEVSVLQFFNVVYNGISLQHCGHKVTVKVLTDTQKSLEQFIPAPKVQDFSKILRAPMPGKIIAIDVQPGTKVYAGQQVAVMEAMKMQNILRSEKDAVVKSVTYKVGDSVAVDATIIEYE